MTLSLLKRRVCDELQRRNAEVFERAMLALTSPPCKHARHRERLREVAAEMDALVLMCDHWSYEGQKRYEDLQFDQEGILSWLAIYSPCGACPGCLRSS